MDLCKRKVNIEEIRKVNMARFRCVNCRFSYVPKSGKKDPPAICGNCGKTGSLRIDPDAEQILRDVNELM